MINYNAENAKGTFNENIKNELENLLTEKIADLEVKTREIIREEINNSLHKQHTLK